MEFNENKMTLDIPEAGKCLEDGWMIIPLYAPVVKLVIDHGILVSKAYRPCMSATGMSAWFIGQ